MEREQDYCAIMKGIQELDFEANALPSDLVLIGSQAFPLAMNPRGQVLIAASRYGQGRIVVLGHEKYLTSFPILVENALAWLMPPESESTTVGIQKNLSSLAENLSYCALKTEVGDFRNVGYAVYVTDAYSVDSCAKDLVAFLKAGGGLLIAGHAWHWAQTNPEENTLLSFPGNKVCSVAGIYFSEIPGECGKCPIPMQIPSNWLAVSIGKDFKDDLQFLLNGVSEFDVRGGALASEVMAHGPLAFPIALTPCGRAFIAGAYYGQGRIIVATHESFLGRDSLSNFLINAIHWLDEGRKGVIGIMPQLKDAHRVLSKSGLKCEFTGLRKDLSVFVCTSYDDSKCNQIQEFVAEGGGLMIGGHAWYWAQSNPALNVMTNCPGNRILSKMGLCIMGNTLGGDLYKAQQMTEYGDRGTRAYHFRDLLQRFAGHVIQGQDLTEHEQNCLQKLRRDCTHYLRMQAHDSASYTSMVSLITDIVKEAGVPQVCQTCPVQSSKDKMLLHVGSEVYRVCKEPDALLPYIIKNLPNLPSVFNARIQISADTSDREEWISTGLYLSPGMRTYIAVPPEIKGKGWQLQIGCQTDCLGEADVLKRAPVVHERFALDSEMLQVWNLWGGLIYLIVPPKSKVKGVEVVVQTAIKAPYYKSGKTSVEDWVKKIRNAPAPWAELEFENVIITLHSDFIRKLDRPDEVAALWDSIMKGVAELAAKPAKFPRKERFVADVQISHGFMHAGYPVMIHSTSAAELVNPETARKTGIWGPIHELGHNQQRSVWEFPPHTTECTCNLWSVYIHEEVLGVKRENAHPNMSVENRKSRTVSYANEGRNLEQWSVWTALETYIQLQEKFGWDAFKKVFAAYHSISNVPQDRDGKMNLYAKTFSNVVNMNLAPFFKAWGWPIQPSTDEMLSSLPGWNDHPMAQYA
ncbi:TRPM8 channel-associated factor homolog [Silurus meridionalis]|uniref:TRPM8 channel-associated factor homolog n=1 Tax=Silurus meridionalis TaxID=175797 RepID=UPI001EEA50C1|nr:TRPM8 channel-associated factor homolog [Silurus meridionalis]XP_046718499.1 TRPM8 channel-associated factor homolog [Silurus meridionalis]